MSGLRGQLSRQYPHVFFREKSYSDRKDKDYKADRPFPDKFQTIQHQNHQQEQVWFTHEQPIEEG